MVRPKTDPEKKLLTETELELMSIVWEAGAVSVNDVVERANRPLAYTSVSTILRILVKKGILGIRKQGRGHLYIPLVEKTAYERKTIEDVVERVFGGEPVAVVRQLLSAKDVSQEEIEEIKKLLEERSE